MYKTKYEFFSKETSKKLGEGTSIYNCGDVVMGRKHSPHEHTPSASFAHQGSYFCRGYPEYRETYALPKAVMTLSEDEL